MKLDKETRKQGNKETKKNCELVKGDRFVCEFGMEGNWMPFEVLEVLPDDYGTWTKLRCKVITDGREEIVCAWKDREVELMDKPAESVEDFVKRVCDRMEREVSELDPYLSNGAFDLIKRMYVKQVLQEEMER